MTWAFTKKKKQKKNGICQIRNKNATLLTLLMNIIIFLNNESTNFYKRISLKRLTLKMNDVSTVRRSFSSS